MGKYYTPEGWNTLSSIQKPKNIWCQCSKLSCLGNLVSGICAPLGYGTTANQLRTTLPTVPILHPLIYRNQHKMPMWSQLTLPGYTWNQFFWTRIQTLQPPWEKCISLWLCGGLIYIICYLCVIYTTQLEYVSASASLLPIFATSFEDYQAQWGGEIPAVVAHNALKAHHALSVSSFCSQNEFHNKYNWLGWLVCLHVLILPNENLYTDQFHSSCNL